MTTLAEALKKSKEDGSTWSRKGAHGWVKYEPGYIYKFGYESLVADDYRMVIPGLSRPKVKETNDED